MVQSPLGAWCAPVRNSGSGEPSHGVLNCLELSIPVCSVYMKRHGAAHFHCESPCTRIYTSKGGKQPWPASADNTIALISRSMQAPIASACMQLVLRQPPAHRLIACCESSIHLITTPTQTLDQQIAIENQGFSRTAPCSAEQGAVLLDTGDCGNM